jgi:hypothetical protein
MTPAGPNFLQRGTRLFRKIVVLYFECTLHMACATVVGDNTQRQPGLRGTPAKAEKYSLTWLCKIAANS